MTKQDLELIFETAKQEGYSLIGVRIRTKGNISDEVIINKKESFDNKLEYYRKSYNDNLVLNAYNGIRIVGIVYGNTFAEIEKHIYS